jgi:glycosyltransferase involved in cell wall biosynthesis
MASDFEGLLAAYLGKTKGSKIVYDIHDTTSLKYYRLPKWIVRLFVWIEKRIAKIADAVIIVDSRRIIELPEIIAAHPRLTVITNSTRDLLDDIHETDRIAPSGKIQICLCGMLLEQRGLQLALDAVRKCKGVHLVLCGMLRNRAMEQIVRSNPNTTYLGNLHHLKALAQMKRSDLILALYDPDFAGHQICAPNKLYESFMLGRPVIVNRRTGLEAMVESDSIGYVIDYGLEGLIHALNRAYEDREALLPELGRRARKSYELKYNWDSNREKLDRLLQFLKIDQNE